MTWIISHDVAEFLAAAGALLNSRPAEHTVLLTVAETLHRTGSAAFGQSAPPRFGWWRSEDETVRSAFLHTPPHPVLLTATSQPAAASLAAMLADGPAVSGVNADPASAQAFAAAWSSRAGVTPRLRRRQRLYRVGQLVPARPAPAGTARVARADDRDLLLAWYEAFGREVGDVAGGLAGVVEDRIGYGGLTLWEVDNTPVALAGRTRLVAGMVRVAPVYTPATLRRRGYGAAVTAAVSRAAQDAGADEIVLFTDLANPTSNALYQRLGFRPVNDSGWFTPSRRPKMGTGRRSRPRLGRGRESPAQWRPSRRHPVEPSGSR